MPRRPRPGPDVLVRLTLNLRRDIPAEKALVDAYEAQPRPQEWLRTTLLAAVGLVPVATVAALSVPLSPSVSTPSLPPPVPLSHPAAAEPASGGGLDWPDDTTTTPVAHDAAETGDSLADTLLD